VHYDRNKTDLKIRSSHNAFLKIQNAASIRMSQSNEVHRLDAICAQVPEELDDAVHGYHRWCYSNFTNVSKLQHMAGTVEDDASYQPCTTGRQQTGVQKVDCNVLFAAECIFCSKSRKRVRGQTEVLVKCLTESAESAVKECATEKGDFQLLGKIDRVHLRAREVQYHEPHRKEYTRRQNRLQDAKAAVATDRSDASCGWKSAYNDAFNYICEHVSTTIIDGGGVERMTMLHDRFIQYIRQHSPESLNEEYRTEKLKARLIAHFGNALVFHQYHSRKFRLFLRQTWRSVRQLRQHLSRPKFIGGALNNNFYVYTAWSSIWQSLRLLSYCCCKASTSSRFQVTFVPSGAWQSKVTSRSITDSMLLDP